ncbi:MAG: 4-hydroxythreonine-4-phosphate dehydrogenase PdxA [Proteobacteria bacterium]|nr:MAG: 4-hydroxythreonine-4-phosphate dehydrogenase PdxA [Pseudomonadota bacterium]
MTQRLRIALSTGEPAGIGPELALMLANQVTWPNDIDIIVLADLDVLRLRARLLNLNIRLRPYEADQAQRPCQRGEMFVLPIATKTSVTPGTLDTHNAASVLAILDRAVEGCQTGEFAAMVTAPVHKGIINDAGVPFSGHTEYLAKKTGTALPVMMLVAGRLKVALATTHLPLSKVSTAITPDLLRQVLHILDHDLREKFATPQAHILVSGLNPHAGEGGHLGMEEVHTIIPVIQQLQQNGMNLTGPLPADTLFTPRHLKTADAVLVMYHDQGLPVLKYAGFGQAVNVTLGLPIIRSSVDHGTALDLAGTGKAEATSLHAALNMAIHLAKQQAKR